ncbi:MAG TPA: prolipoprotein diacylglyceryl transferase [Xanthobacteraceae bacterium]|nr:prolipoprotein diacylglyceryl transferase [Xanthobacteraceae bacterium]
MPISIIPFPDLNPVLVTIGPFAIRWYALGYIFGILFGWLYARAIIRNERNWGGPAPLKVEDLDDFILWVTLGIILGGRTGYVLFYNLPYFIAHPLEIFQVWKGGMSFHGGFLGCVVAVMGFATVRRLSVLSLGDITCAVAPIGILLVRLANFVNGELWGRPADVPWAMIFPHGGPFPRHPSQLYEAGLEGLVLLMVLGLMVRAGALRRPGLILGAFAAIYAVMRSFCELFREPDPQLGFLWGGMTMGMLLSIPLFIAGVLLIGFALRRQPAYP